MKIAQEVKSGLNNLKETFLFGGLVYDNMVEKARYRVHNFESYDQLCNANINNVDAVFVEEITDTELIVEEVNNIHGEGASNTIDRDSFESLISGGYVEESSYSY